MADDARVGPRLVVGLTGGIASGKSLVGAMFVKLGAALVDTDVVAREVVAAGEPGLAAVAAEFGPGVLLPSGELNRPALRSLVFADDAKRRKLEAILHPLIRSARAPSSRRSRPRTRSSPCRCSSRRTSASSSIGFSSSTPGVGAARAPDAARRDSETGSAWRCCARRSIARRA